MSETTKEIISNAEIERVHANANFGDMTKRDVVDDTVTKAAFGYHTGYTAGQIAHEHGLVRVPRAGGLVLTQKGYRYLHAMYGGKSSAIFELRNKS